MDEQEHKVINYGGGTISTGHAQNLGLKRPYFIPVQKQTPH